MLSCLSSPLVSLTTLISCLCTDGDTWPTVIKASCPLQKSGYLTQDDQASDGVVSLHLFGQVDLILRLRTHSAWCTSRPGPHVKVSYGRRTAEGQSDVGTKDGRILDAREYGETSSALPSLVRIAAHETSSQTLQTASDASVSVSAARPFWTQHQLASVGCVSCVSARP